jgi:hypothetical protein
MEAKDPNNKKIEKGHKERKFWKVTGAGGTLKFYPVFMINEETKEVECRTLEMTFETDHKEHKFVFDWLNIFMFIYYTANEELRQQLASRYERKVNYIPYELTIPVTPEDARVGNVKRRVELPIDELTMAVAREEAWKIFLRNKDKVGDPRAFIYKKNKR